MLPAAGSLYWDYLGSFPVDVKMTMHLHADADEADDLEFIAHKTSHDKWRVTFTHGALTTRELFDHVVEMMQGEESIVVSHGKDPRAVKKEYIERDSDDSEEDDELRGIKFFSIGETIDLEEEHTEGAGASAVPQAAATVDFEKVVLSLAKPVGYISALDAAAESDDRHALLGSDYDDSAEEGAAEVEDDGDFSARGGAGAGAAAATMAAAAAVMPSRPLTTSSARAPV